ncbi:hypothetical protein GQ44DRAFT_833258 [Phaeosphaeriaceae sp. PMI808]|nr:hypothetical protein GQ44DRAFT_833258 [Phaeosphaeriaceae sp. PMI808]
MPGYSELIQEVERKRVTFECNDYQAPSPWDVKRWGCLLKEDEDSLNSLSSGRQSIWRRARDIATSILRKLGPEVLLLVISLHNTNKMAKLDRQRFVYDLQVWWRAVPHPFALTLMAKDCFPMPVRTMSLPIPLALQMPTGAIPTRQGAPSAFETAIMLAAQSIPELENRDAWTTTALAHLHLLKRLNDTVHDERASVIMPDVDQREIYTRHHHHHHHHHPSFTTPPPYVRWNPPPHLGIPGRPDPTRITVKDLLV